MCFLSMPPKWCLSNDLALHREWSRTDAKKASYQGKPAPGDPSPRKPLQAPAPVLDRYDLAILRRCRPTRAFPTPNSPRASAQRGADLAKGAPAGRAGLHHRLSRRDRPARVGLGVLAFVRVDAERNNAESTRALEQAIRARPEVVACHYISGTGTFELQVVATDLDAFSRLSMEVLFKLPNVKDMHTRFSLGEVKAGAGLPLGHLAAPPNP
jgi:Lrp/AsnC family leucine-responsive transcriptional regulator